MSHHHSSLHDNHNVQHPSIRYPIIHRQHVPQCHHVRNLVHHIFDNKVHRLVHIFEWHNNIGLAIHFAEIAAAVAAAVVSAAADPGHCPPF